MSVHIQALPQTSSHVPLALPPLSTAPAGSPPAISLSTIHDPVLRQGLRQALAGDYDKALTTLSRASQDPQVINTKGVCLLRLGRIDEAVRVYRGLVLKTNCTWMRPELPTVHKTNFATALLLDVSVGGCMEVLNEIQDQQHPSVLRLRAAVDRWVRDLTWWQRFNWRCGRLEPPNRPVTIDFPPGEFA